ncbi:MAG: adenosylcobinamide-GDP ribazoletransferase, partial [Cyanobacteriota bacterium]
GVGSPMGADGAPVGGGLVPLPPSPRIGGFHRQHWAGLLREARPGLLAVGGLLLLCWLRGWPPIGLAGALPALLVPRWLGRRLGGHSGDSYGACVEWTEMLALLLSGLTQAMTLGWQAG